MCGFSCGCGYWWGLLRAWVWALKHTLVQLIEQKGKTVAPCVRTGISAALEYPESHV